MKQFGTNEYGNKEGFKIVCCKCGKEGWAVPISHYEHGINHCENGKYGNPDKITFEFRCSCGNRYGATIYEKN